MSATVRIGDVEIPGRVSLAPLAGVTDLPFRLLCKEFGAAMLTTEMVSAEGVVRGHGPTLEYMRFDDRERPIAVQLWGHDAKTLAEAARIVVDRVGPEIVDVNFGCPVKKIVGKGAGSACLREPERVGDILAAMVAAVDVPVTAKIRAGWDRPVAPEVAVIAEEAGAAALSIHGRTRDQSYRGEANWDLVREAVRRTSRLRIIGNGDVTTPSIARERFEQTGCAMIMIGRGAMGQPWIFRQIGRYLSHGELLAAPSEPQRVEIAIRHYESAIDFKGPETAVREMRGHLASYLRHRPDFGELRKRLFAESDPFRAVSILRDLARETDGDGDRSRGPLENSAAVNKMTRAVAR